MIYSMLISWVKDIKTFLCGQSQHLEEKITHDVYFQIQFSQSSKLDWIWFGFIPTTFFTLGLRFFNSILESLTI